jgi:hypothetical protein
VDEQAQVVEGKRRRSRADAEQLVADYETSGLSRIEFCQQHRLSLATLDRYRKRRQAQGGAVGNRWLAVELSGAAAAGSATASGLAVMLPGGRRIEVLRGFDAPTLERLLSVLERG